MYEKCEVANIFESYVSRRLYCEANDSRSRRSAQTCIHEVSRRFLRIVAPVVPHLAEEAWHCLPAIVRGKENLPLFKTVLGPSPGIWRGQASLATVDAVKAAEELRRMVVASPAVGSSSPRQFDVVVTVGCRETFEKLEVSKP